MLILIRHSTFPNQPFIFQIFLLSLVAAELPQQCRRFAQKSWGSFQPACDIPLDSKKRTDAYNLTTPREFPYAVLVFCPEGKANFICSGSLLTRLWTLTARHCFYECKSAPYVYAGGNSIHEVQEQRFPKESQLREVSKICKHETFDMALVKVKRPFELSVHVNTIKLPSRPLPEKEMTCTFTAFGRLKMSINNQMDYKRKTQVMRVVCPCEYFYVNWRESNYPVMVGDGSNFVCSVPRDDYGVCKGDSGSGLVCDRVVHGVTKSIVPSSGYQKLRYYIYQDPVTRKLTCGTENTTSVFVAVYPLVNWLKRTMHDPEVADCHDHAEIFGSSFTLFLGILSLVLSNLFVID